uniref:Glycosyltransferase n=1 Tax=Populus davidiana TaxID=266767 RepID=A0A6M2FBK2_9ROSI
MSDHVAVFAFPFGTHAPPLLAIIHRLATSSPNTHFSFFSTQQSNSSIFSIYKQNMKIMQPNIKAYEVWDGAPEGYVFSGNPQEHIELFMKSARESFKKAMEVAVSETGRKVSCLVSDAFFWFAGEMAEEIGVVWLPFWTAGPTSLSAHVYTDLIRDTFGVGGVAGHEDELLSLIPGMSKIRIRDLPEGVLFGNLESFFSNMLHKMGRALPQAAAVFINSFEELDPRITRDFKSRFKEFLNIGPLNMISPAPPAADTYGCITWLDRQKLASVAYLSFGSITTPPPHELVALAEALETSGVPFIWSLKDNSKVHLPDGFLDRTTSQGLLVPWTPQSEVLAHKAVGVFITHCGWNSLLESIAGGVPMICRPFFGDQRLNGRMVEDAWKIGLQVEDGVFRKHGVLNSLDKVLSQDSGEKMRENIRALQQLAKKAIGPNGSSINNFVALSDLVFNTKI